jgi:hypothetical protein
LSGTKINGASLRDEIIRSLKAQGFIVHNGAILPPERLTKQGIRDLHETAVNHRIDRAKTGLSPKEKDLLRYVASGEEVVPSLISPRLIEVKRRSVEELLFRYATLHWSIPVSSGYGRRLRFLVIDDNNGKLIGLIGLGDPVFSLGPRDSWIGWTPDDRKERIGHLMDAFVLGAVPPYSFLLCGKLVAMLTASETVRSVFLRKYGGVCSVIRQKIHDGRLALITTTSALGRSSIYNRLRIGKRYVFQSVGFTRGSGEFHFSNGLYEDIVTYAEAHCKPTAKQGRWGSGFRNRREVLKKCLPALGLSSDWLYHGIKREVFVNPLACNTQGFLKGHDSCLRWHQQSEKDIIEFFRDRWMLPRAAKDKRYRSWVKDEWIIWKTVETKDG